MRTSNVLFAFALPGSLAVSAWLWGELRAERELNAALVARIDLAAASAVAPASAATAVSSTPAAATLVATAEPAKPVVQSTPVASGPKEDSDSYERRLLRDPKYREAWREQMRLKFSLRRENIIRLVGLTPEQADAVIDMDVDRQLSWQELPATPAGATEEYWEQLRKLDEENERVQQENLRTLLGEEKRAQLQSYMESRSSRIKVDQLRTQLTGPDVLREDQVEALIAAMHAERLKTAEEMSELQASIDWTSGTEDAQRRVAERQLEVQAALKRMHAAAAPVLSRQQLEKFDAILKRDLEMQKAEQRMDGVQTSAD